MSIIPAHIPGQTPDPNESQHRAAIPHHDVWVAASAGSGKTKVLTDRVLRLLLPDSEGHWPGTPPHKILCITFTKAAAALMAIRIQKRLGQWAMMKEDELQQDLASLTRSTVTPDMITAARRLFSQVLDVPGGLSIMTIHSFCQSVLARFPVEAGLTPGFKVMDDTPARDLLSKSVMDMVMEIEQGQSPHLEPAFATVALSCDFDALKDSLLNLLDQSEELGKFFEQYGRGEQLYRNLLSLMGVDKTATENTLLEDFSTTRPEPELLELAPILCSSGSRNAHIGQGIADWLALSAKERTAQWKSYYSALMTGENTPRKIFGKIDEKYPALYDTYLRETEALQDVCERIAILKQSRQSADFLTLADEAIRRYIHSKKQHNTLDFGDLILKTKELLEHAGQEWVHYKLDEGIDHILVDEAQDTNRHQWDIIRYLSAEFLSGWGRENGAPRSLFVVGDQKQSIFSFHGADPDAFADMHDFFAQRSAESKRTFDPVRLDTSFRTTPPVLKLVDEVFAPPALAQCLGLKSGEQLLHHSFRAGDAGQIELWDVITTEKENTSSADTEWKLPFASERQSTSGHNHSGDGNLAVRIAHHIWQMIANKELLVSENRPVEPRDILILVRTRTGSLVNDLVRQLKLRQIAVSGVDRMQLREQIAVEDCLALARFARLADDDLSLACLLKSPFIRINENELMELALGRAKDTTLWTRVQETLSPEIISWLKHKIILAQTRSPFNFFDETLSCPCPYDASGSARRAFSTLLGPDCLDPLDEFLGFCLKAEQESIYGLEEFITYFEKNPIEIKRELEDSEKESGNQVRIMTVHASKGLEAPIVFLPDTTSRPSGSKIARFLWADSEQGLRLPLWSASSDDSAPLYRQTREKIKNKDYAEYLRLLYVALTRARDRLYICGTVGTKGLPDNPEKPTWYHLVRDAFDRMDIPQDGHSRTLKTMQKGTAKSPEGRAEENRLPNCPDWLHLQPPAEAEPRRYIQPSMIGRDLDPAISPLQTTAEHRFERGLLTHRLFEFLPDIDPSLRRQAAQRFLEKNASTLPASLQSNILEEVFSILDDSVFADVFGPDSLAEVPVTGDIGGGRILSGQIDRLLIGKERILIVDFKTNRPSPRHQSEIPENYKDQLRAYKYAISMIYPDRTVQCALLWTDRAVLMPIDV